MEKLIVNLRGKFWTRENEMLEELFELGIEVLDITYEYIELMDIDERIEDEPKTQRLELIRAGDTIAIDI